MSTYELVCVFCCFFFSNFVSYDIALPWKAAIKHWPNSIVPCLPTFHNSPAAVACSRMLSSVTHSLCLLWSTSQLSCGGGTGQRITAGFPLPEGASEMAGQHLITLETTLTVLLGETQEPLKSSSQTSSAVTPVSHHYPWWWEGLHPQDQTLESQAHTSPERGKGRA